MSERETLDTDLNKNDRTNDNSTVLRKKNQIGTRLYPFKSKKKSMKALI